MQYIAVPGTPLQQWAGENQMPTQWTTVSSEQQGATQLPLGSRSNQVGAKTAQQNKVRGRKRLPGKLCERLHVPTGISSPPLANQTHDLPPDDGHAGSYHRGVLATTACRGYCCPVCPVEGFTRPVESPVRQRDARPPAHACRGRPCSDASPDPRLCELAPLSASCAQQPPGLTRTAGRVRFPAEWS